MRTHDRHSIHALHIAGMQKCRGAGRCVGRGQVNNQLAADPADNFTPRTGTLGHTCVNCIRVGAFSNCTPPFPSFPLRSTLMSLWKWSGLVAVLVRTCHDQSRDFVDNQDGKWATLAEGQRVAHHHLFFS